MSDYGGFLWMWPLLHNINDDSACHLINIEEKLRRVKDRMFYFGVCRTNVNNGGN